MTTTFSFATPAAASSYLTATNFNALANNTCKLGAVVTPGSNPPLFAKPILTAKYQANITAGTLVGKGWFIEAADGTNYDANGAASDGTTTAPARAPDFVFYWTNVASTLGPDILSSSPAVVQRPSNLFKVLYQNTSGQAHTANNTDSTLQESTMNEFGT